MKALTNGALAGLIGTAAMTAAQAAEMRVTGRPPSTVPGQVASKLLGLKPGDDEALSRISLGMHWTHGMTQGAVRALVGRSGLRGAAAAAAHFALMWSSDVMLYKALGISPWPWHWSVEELAPDIGHKGLYAVVTSAAYDRLS
ncbi:MAG: hypothetical protein H0V08_05590 [Thermoleophilaceae bacterium]|jgi:hypothetical protein|nr:hypothetical protein [Thermoleophilaceae bacterium]